MKDALFKFIEEIAWTRDHRDKVVCVSCDYEEERGQHADDCKIMELKNQLDKLERLEPVIESIGTLLFDIQVTFPQVILTRQDIDRRIEETCRQLKEAQL